MPLLKAQSDLLAREDLTAGIGKTFIERGAGDLADVVPFKSFSGETSSFNIQKSRPGFAGTLDPYNTSGEIDNSPHEIEKISTATGLIAKHADTPVVDKAGKSGDNDQEALNIDSAAQQVYEEWAANVTSSSGLGNTLRGLPYWIHRYYGFVDQGYGHASGWLSSMTDSAGLYGGSGRAAFTGNVIYGTNTKAVDGTKQTLTDTVLDTLVTMPKRRPTAILATLEARNAIKAILNDAGGNTAQALMSEAFGRKMIHWDDVPVHVVDSLGDAKVGTGAVIASTTLTAAAADKRFAGFKMWDVGRVITLSNGQTVTIESVTSASEVELVSAPAAGNGTYNFTIPAKPDLLIAFRGDEKSGLRACYNPTEGMPSEPDVDVYGTPIAGFSAVNVGLLPDAEVERHRVRMYSNLEYCDPNTLAVLSQFSIPA